MVSVVEWHVPEVHRGHPSTNHLARDEAIDDSEVAACGGPLHVVDGPLTVEHDGLGLPAIGLAPMGGVSDPHRCRGSRVLGDTMAGE